MGNVLYFNYNRGIWNLYEEGFAQFFQYRLLAEEVNSRDRKWFEKCKINTMKASD